MKEKKWERKNKCMLITIRLFRVSKAKMDKRKECLNCDVI
jgi:aspartyl/asparaginyl beta-hydroxylase (cupin superfamily)